MMKIVENPGEKSYFKIFDYDDEFFYMPMAYTLALAGTLTGFHEFSSKEYCKIAVAAVLNGDNEFIYHKILPHYFDKCDKNFIDVLIECSIDNEYPKITAMLLDFKYKHHLFTEKKWEL